MNKIEVILKNETGLHARPASMLIKEASKYTSEIKVVKEGIEYNGKSIMGILSMGACKGDKLEIIAVGNDEEQAVNALQELVDNNFDE